MTPKFRIYDNREEKYCEEDAPLMLCMDGCIFDRANEDWYEVGERYVVEMATGVFDLSGTYIYEGDVFESLFLGDEEPNIDFVAFDEDQFKLKLHDIYLSCAEQSKIIGTIHDEKYKGL